MTRFKTAPQLIITLSLSLLSILFILAVLPKPMAQALDSYSVYYVAPSCTGVPTPCFTSIQAAVDAVDEPIDVVKVAAGTYTDVHQRPRNDITTTGVVTQIVYLSKTLTIRGGYTTTNWTTSDPDVNLTTLDAQGQGRVFYITGDISPTIEGLRLTGGDATGLLGGAGPLGTLDYDTGGGVYAITASLTLKHNEVFSNVVSKPYAGGGASISRGHADLIGNSFESNASSGLFLDHSTATIEGNIFTGNVETGLSLEYSTATIQDNTFTANFVGVSIFRGSAVLRANQILSSTSDALSVGGGSFTVDSNFIANNGGEGIGVGEITGGILGNTIVDNRRGIDVAKSSALTVSHNTILYNSGLGYGGGLLLHGNRGTPGIVVSDNWIEGNGGFAGGGLSIDFSDASLIGNTIISNTAQASGGGINATDRCRLILFNNIIAGNTISTTGDGAGLYLLNSDASLIHNTIAYNSGGDGSGLFLAATDGKTYAITMTNSIVASHTIGITSAGGSATLTARIDHTLWSGNTVNWTGGEITSTHNYTGAPLFVNPDAGDYHIGPGSAAIDRGIRTDVFFDIDNEPRVNTPDLGADEYWAPGALKQMYLPVLIKN